MMEKECELWLVCGPGAIYHYHGKYLFSNDDPRRNYRDNFCFNDFEKCDHFLPKKRIQKEKESNYQKGGGTMSKMGEKNYVEEAKMNTMIVVPAPYKFESEAKILKREGLIVKNCWSTGPAQEELDKVISAIEVAIKFLEGNS